MQQSHGDDDLRCGPSVDNPCPPDLSTMLEDEEPSTLIHTHEEPKHQSQNPESNYENETKINGNSVVRRERPSRACTARSAARLYAAAEAEAALAAAVRRQKVARKERMREEPQPPSPPPPPQCKIITPLVAEPPPSQLPRWSLRSMWELASILNFLNVFRPFLNIKVEFSAEEFETALITPNNTLGDIHIPLLKAIPPITRMALGHNTWITVLCRKLRDWWHWVAEGELPIVASHGAEIEAYNALDPGVRVVILKALCDIRVEQEDIRNYIDDSIKHGVHLSTFRKERIGGDAYGISYWYEDDPIIGHRLYREIRKVEVKKAKGKNVQPIPSSSYQWEMVASNLDEFEDVSEKLFSSKNRTEASLGKKLKSDMLPEIDKVHKRKEKLLKKQHRQALLLDNMINVDGLAQGRSLRDRKPVTYTFDDYDRSINEAIKITKRKQSSPEPTVRREFVAKAEASINGSWSGPSQIPEQGSFDMPSPESFDYDETDMDHKPELLDRSNRRRQRPQRYSAKEFVEAVSENEADFDSDDDIVGEAVYDEAYLRQRKKMRKMSSSSEGDEEYHWDDENAEEEEEEEDDVADDSLSNSDSSDEPRRFKKLPGRTRREIRLRSVDELQSGLRRSKRAMKNRINYKQYEMSESEVESTKPEKSNALDEHTDTDNAEFSLESQDSEGNNDNKEIKEVDQPVEEEHPETVEKERNQPPEKSNSPGQDEIEGVRKRRFLDLNELAPSCGFEDGPNTTMKDEDPADDF
ncbi:DDT domain-containing protein DDR4-like [Camellia sinensis]|uniref:DDT domain-containing protein DDR4-like n=1 Tax=Camellia sinensis TaxID=4442 RepID=UPI001036D607|nr:DDT domain-containing protein DDR4-like [Camellia sinensis]